MTKRFITVAASVIVILHGAALWFLFGGCAGNNTAHDETADTETRQAGEYAETQTSPYSDAARPENVYTPPAAPSDPDAPRPPETRPFDASGARYGALKNIPLTNTVKGGILADLTSRRILWAKNSSVKRPIASLTKIMTLLTAYAMTHDPSSGLSIYSVVTVVPETMRVAPSRVDLRTGEVFTLEELMTAASVRSANDAAFQIAHFAGGGSVEEFIKKMNANAARLNMRNTIFFNPHGLPGTKSALDNTSTPLDLLKLCEEFMRYPVLMRWAATREATFRNPLHERKVVMRNHNNLLPGARAGVAGVNGIKTGFTQRAGFCVAASCERSGRRMLVIILGAPTSQERDKCAAALLEWGFKQ